MNGGLASKTLLNDSDSNPRKGATHEFSLSYSLVPVEDKDLEPFCLKYTGHVLMG